MDDHQPTDPPYTPMSGDKPRLTDAEKKNNHIASEHKRREGIRNGFDQLASLTPGMEGQGRSEAVLLARFNHEMRRQLITMYHHVQVLRANGQDTTRFEFDVETMRLAEKYAREDEDQQLSGQPM